MSITAIKKIAAMTAAELEEEELKLKALLRNVQQEYLDREETIMFIVKQLEEVNNIRINIEILLYNYLYIYLIYE